MDRWQLVSYIKQKDIILFGAGNFAKQFYQDFKDELHICLCISNNKLEKKFQIDGSMVCEVKDAAGFKLMKNQFIITCSADSGAMQEQLSDMGYVMGQDYIDSQYYRLLVSHKKIAVFYGVCYMRALKECLEASAFSEVYESLYFLDYIKYGFVEKSFMYTALECCDLFVYTSYFSPESLRKLDAFFIRLKNGCRKLSVPLLTFNGFHPRKHGSPLSVNPYCIVSNKSPYAPFITEDENMNDMIEKGVKREKIIESVCDVDFYTNRYVCDNFEQECRRIKTIERFSDIKVSPIISENYNKLRLFLNESHLSNEFILEICKRILEVLGVPVKLEEETIRQKTLLFSSEVPLYPSVIHHLNLKQYQDGNKYKLFTFCGNKMVTFEEYADMYIEYITTMRYNILKGNFPNG